MGWEGVSGIFIWCSLCCSVGLVMFSNDGRCWWFDADSWGWFWMHGSVVDRKGSVGGCSGGAFVGGVAYDCSEFRLGRCEHE